MSEVQEYIGVVVEVGEPERSASGENWKKALVKIHQGDSQYAKSFRVWPYVRDDSGDDVLNPVLSYAKALLNTGTEVRATFTEGGYQGQRGYVKQNDLLTLDNGAQVTHSVEAGGSLAEGSLAHNTGEWPEPTTSSPPPTNGALSVAEGAVLDAQQALTTALNAIRATAGATF